MREKDLMKAIADTLWVMERAGKVAWWTRVNSGMIFGSYKGKGWAVRNARTGTPDVCGFLRGGQFFAIEAKGTGGKLTEEQAETLKTIRKHGGIAILAYSVADVEAGLG